MEENKAKTETVKISDLFHLPYGIDEYHSCNPSETEIKFAKDHNQYDARPFQIDKGVTNPELWREWNLDTTDLADVADRAKTYHAKRIAYLENQDVWEPITLKINSYSHDGKKEIADGSHRFEARKLHGYEDIEVYL